MNEKTTPPIHSDPAGERGWTDSYMESIAFSAHVNGTMGIQFSPKHWMKGYKPESQSTEPSREKEYKEFIEFLVDCNIINDDYGFLTKAKSLLNPDKTDL